jgi:hypothetical protein
MKKRINDYDEFMLIGVFITLFWGFCVVLLLYINVLPDVWKYHNK